MKLSDHIKRMQDLLASDGDIHLCAHVWAPEDVILYAKDRNKRVTKAQANEVIDRMEHGKDCSIGINWEVLDVHMCNVLDEAKAARKAKKAAE